MTRVRTLRSHRCGAPTDDSPRREPWVPHPEGSSAPAGRQTRHAAMKKSREAAKEGEASRKERKKPQEWRALICSDELAVYSASTVFNACAG